MSFDFDAAVTAPFRIQPGLRRLAPGALHLTPLDPGSRQQREKLAVLSAFAEVCAQQMRSNDRLGRYGGEEFLLIMPGSDLTQVPQVFTRLRTAIQQIHVAGLLAGRTLTFSMGAVEVSGPPDDLDNLMKRADDALYRAKQGGRDRYELG